MIKLFTKVKCHAYYKKAHDYVHLVVYDENGNIIDNPTYIDEEEDIGKIKVVAYKKNPDYVPNVTDYTIEFADLSEFDGETVEKTCYELVNKEFTGCVVGYTQLVVTKYLGTDLGTDIRYDAYYSYGYLFKRPKDVVKVAKVYFKNNVYRYVPVDAMEEGKQ